MNQVGLINYFLALDCFKGFEGTFNMAVFNKIHTHFGIYKYESKGAKSQKKETVKYDIDKLCEIDREKALRRCREDPKLCHFSDL